MDRSIRRWNLGEWHLEHADGSEWTQDEVDSLPCKGDGWCPGCEAYECPVHPLWIRDLP